MPNLELLPAIAGGLGIISLSTLVHKVYLTHNTTSFPYSWLFINLTAQVLSLIYALANKAWGIYIPNTVFLIGLSYMLYVKVFTENKTPGQAGDHDHDNDNDQLQKRQRQRQSNHGNGNDNDNDNVNNFVST